MDKRFLTPEEVANATINASIKKASLDTTSCIWLGILAGIFIGLGGAGNILASQTPVSYTHLDVYKRQAPKYKDV